MELMVLRSRSEIPQDRLVILRKEGEAIRLVLSPRTDVGRGQVPNIVHVEAQQRTHFRLLQKILGAREAFAAQAIEVDTIFPIHRHRSICGQSHRILLCWEVRGQIAEVKTYVPALRGSYLCNLTS